ncbi:MAG TPA: hypothetical protein VIY28_02430 [Pseudonocardiaceae bacterium]
MQAPSSGSTLPPGSALPSGADCAGRAQAGAGRELRPGNDAANHSVPPAGVSVPPWQMEGYAPEFNRDMIPRIDGRFTGTTDEILAWGACKWGFDADVVRAMAAEESDWDQSLAGDLSRNPRDCVGGDTVPCPTSFGIMQVRHTFRPGSYPYSARHTAFNVDYALGVIRACYEGWVTYLDNGYQPGDLWGCLGWHFSGEWRNRSALGYINRVQRSLAAKPWLDW